MTISTSTRLGRWRLPVAVILATYLPTCLLRTYYVLQRAHCVLTACSLRTHQVAALAHLEVATVVAGASHSFAITTDGT